MKIGIFRALIAEQLVFPIKHYWKYSELDHSLVSIMSKGRVDSWSNIEKYDEYYKL